MQERRKMKKRGGERAKAAQNGQTCLHTDGQMDRLRQTEKQQTDKDTKIIERKKHK